MFAKAERAHKATIKHQLVDGSALVAKPTSHLAGREMRWETASFQGLIKMESAEGSDPGVSETFQHIHATEVPVWPDPDETFSRLLPTLPDDPGTSFIGEFTARTEGDYTHGQWLEAERGDSWLDGVFLPWYWHEDYTRKRHESDAPLSYEEKQFRKLVAELGHEYPLVDGTIRLKPKFAKLKAKHGALTPSLLASGFNLSDEQLLWRRRQIKKFRGDMAKWRSEFPSTPGEAFQSASRKLIDSGVMDTVDQNSKVPILDRGEYVARRGHRGKAIRKWTPTSSGRVIRWEPPMVGKYYVVSADTSSGTSRDFSAAHVWRIEREMIHLAASFRGAVRPADFAGILSRIGSHYRTHAEPSATKEGAINPRSGIVSLMVVERNHHGVWVLYELRHNLKYTRLYKHDSRGTSQRWKVKDDYGFPTTKASKMPMLLNMVQLCFDERVSIPCEQTRAEMRGMVYLKDDDTEAGAVSGGFDDMAMSAGIGLWVASQKGRFRGANMSKGRKPIDILFKSTGR